MRYEQLHPLRPVDQPDEKRTLEKSVDPRRALRREAVLMYIGNAMQHTELTPETRIADLGDRQLILMRNAKAMYILLDQELWRLSSSAMPIESAWHQKVEYLLRRMKSATRDDPPIDIDDLCRDRDAALRDAAPF